MRLLLAATAATTALALAAPVQAATWTGSDPQGDGAVAADVASAKLNHKPGAAITTIGFHSLRRKRVANVFIALYVEGTGGKGYMLNGFRKPGATKLSWQLLYGVPFSDGGADTVRCPGKEISWKDLSVRARIPRSCLKPAAKRMSLGVSVSTLTKGDGLPDARLHGPWVAAG